MRTSPAVKIMRGPLVLAKAEIVGTPESEMISHESIHGNNPELQLKSVGSVEFDNRRREAALHSCLRLYFSR